MDLCTGKHQFEKIYQHKKLKAARAVAHHLSMGRFISSKELLTKASEPLS